MSYADDEMIAAEDAPTTVQPMTSEEMTQVMRVLDRVDQTPTLAALPDFSTLATVDDNENAYWFDANATKKLARDAARRFAIGRTEQPDAVIPSAIGDLGRVFRPFRAPRDLPAALDEGQLTRATWGTMNVGHPIVVAALQVAEDAEGLSRKYGARYRCDECLEHGKIETFPWAGALFVHLLTCEHFAADVDGRV